MNENTYIERTPLYGVDALAIAEYGVRTIIWGVFAPGYLQSAYMEPDGRVCLKIETAPGKDTPFRPDGTVRYAAGAALNGIARAMKLSNVPHLKIVSQYGRAREYGCETFKFVAAALVSGRVPADEKSTDIAGLIKELGQFRATAMITPMNPAEVEFATNFEDAYVEMFEKANADVKAAVRAAKEAEAAVRAELDKKLADLREKKTGDIREIRARLVSDAAKLAKEVGFDGLRRTMSAGDPLLSDEIEKRVADVA